MGRLPNGKKVMFQEVADDDDRDETGNEVLLTDITVEVDHGAEEEAALDRGCCPTLALFAIWWFMCGACLR